MTAREVVEHNDVLTGSDLQTIHIIGGGSKNELLDQFAANATKRTVVTGPVEATALGNVLVQAVALGKITMAKAAGEALAAGATDAISSPRFSNSPIEFVAVLVTGLLAVAILHNLTPYGFLAEVLRGRERRTALIVGAIVVVGMIRSEAFTKWIAERTLALLAAGLVGMPAGPGVE